jgi:hypothetical protein
VLAIHPQIRKEDTHWSTGGGEIQMTAFCPKKMRVIKIKI